MTIIAVSTNNFNLRRVQIGHKKAALEWATPTLTIQFPAIIMRIQKALPENGQPFKLSEVIAALAGVAGGHFFFA